MLVLPLPGRPAISPWRREVFEPHGHGPAALEVAQVDLVRLHLRATAARLEVGHRLAHLDAGHAPAHRDGKAEQGGRAAGIGQVAQAHQGRAFIGLVRPPRASGSGGSGCVRRPAPRPPCPDRRPRPQRSARRRSDWLPIGR